MSTLEERIRRLEDRAEIQDLVAAYFRAVDDDDYAVVARCFTPDAQFVASGFTGDRSREAVVAFLKLARSGMGQTVHTPNYVQIEFTGDGAASGLVPGLNLLVPVLGTAACVHLLHRSTAS